LLAGQFKMRLCDAFKAECDAMAGSCKSIILNDAHANLKSGGGNKSSLDRLLF